MTTTDAFDYSQAPFSVRSDLTDAYRRTWDWLSAPGSWWSGDEKIAIAAEVRAARDCALCAARKQALSPGAVDGTHDRAVDRLPEAAIDAVHRLVTDAARLSKSWVEKLLASGSLSDGHYVELLGVTVSVLCIDAFHRALGLPLEPLPAPAPGPASGYRPAAASDGVGWVPMIPGGEARGPEADLYQKGRAANVLRAMSLVPDCVRRMKDLSMVQYIPLDQLANPSADPGRALSRAQIELVAGRVSAVNECFY